MRNFLAGKLKPVLIIVAAVVVLLTAMIIVYLSGIGAVNSGNDKPVGVIIPQGSGSSAIVEILDDKGLVKNKTFAKIHARIGGYDTLQANAYTFNKSMSLPEIFKAINTGDMNYIAREEFTIVEGYTVPEAAAAVAEKFSFDKNELLALWSDKTYLNSLIDKYWFLTDDILKEGIMYPLEGYLYPETYFVMDAEPTMKSITQLILDTADKEFSKDKKPIESSGMSIHELLSFTSVVVCESGGSNTEKSKIAGVFVNRLDDGMPLQSDVTVNYAKQQKRVDVSTADTQVDSKYNTYQNTGLPIGPICAVNIKSMECVVKYEKSDYLYFFATKDGEVLYSKTVAEHEKTVEENLWY